MSKRYVMVLAVAALLASTPASSLADGVVIANPGLNLSAGDVRDVFTGEKQLAGSIRLVPIDNAAAQADFLAKVLKMDATKYQTTWTKKSFRDGVTAPAVKATDAEVVEFVKRSPGGVGYISGGAPSGVTIVSHY
jgi:hypothetical protein